MWRLPQVDRRRYPRNALEVVVVQVRFHPILKLPSRIGEFQDHVRERFPSFSDEQLRSFDLLLPEGNARVRTDQLFRFASVVAPRHIQVTTSSLTLEVKDYQRREDLEADLSLGLKALQDGVGTPSLIRLGLRFVNVLAREKIAADLGRPVMWPDLVAEEFLRAPPFFDDAPPRSYHELTAPLEPGALTLRYGFLPAPQSPGQLYFRFDMDRYVEDVIPLNQVPELLRRFTDDCFALFEKSVTPTLREWMEQPSHGS